MFSSLQKKIKRKTKRIDELKGIKDRQLTEEEQAELDKLIKDKKKLKTLYLTKIAAKTAKKTLSTIISLLVSFFTMLMSLLGVFGILILVVVLLLVMVVGVAFSALSGTIFTGGNWPDDGGKPAPKGVPGARYVFNVADMNLLETEYQKNIYILAWLWTNVKNINSDITIPVTNALGEPVLEYGPRFFKPYDNSYENNLIFEKACGFPNESSAGEICQGLYACNSTKFNEGIEAYWKNLGYADFAAITEAVWGDIPYKEKLPAPVYKGELSEPVRADNVIYSFWNDYKEANDYSVTVYDAAYQVMYAGYINASNKNALKMDNGGHAYGKYYREACKNRDLDADDSTTYQWFLNSIAYLFHAGSMKGAFVNTTDRDDALYAAFDYLAYVYVTLYKDADWCSFKSGGPDIDWGSPTGCGNNNILECAYGYKYQSTKHGRAYGGGGSPYYESSVCYIKDKNNNSPVKNNLAYLWYNSLTGDMKNKADKLQLAFAACSWSDNTIINNKDYDKYLASQSVYATMSGWATALGGVSRLNVIFDKLKIDWTVDEQGFICYAQSGIPVTPGYNPAVAVDVFDSTKGKNSYWQKDWFQEINDKEWSLPIDFGEHGEKARVSSLFGERDYKNNEFHCGMDMYYIGAQDYINKKDYDKIPIYAMHDGTVINMTKNNPSCGNYFMYECTWQVYNKATNSWDWKTGRFLCMHMSKFADNLAVGDKISRGQIIGYMGNTGGVSAHLHIQMTTAGVDRAWNDKGIRNIVAELPFFTWLSGYKEYVESGTDGRLKGKPIELGWSNQDGSNADTATNSDEHP